MRRRDSSGGVAGLHLLESRAAAASDRVSKVENRQNRRALEHELWHAAVLITVGAGFGPRQQLLRAVEPVDGLVAVTRLLRGFAPRSFARRRSFNVEIVTPRLQVFEIVALGKP